MWQPAIIDEKDKVRHNVFDVKLVRHHDRLVPLTGTRSLVDAPELCLTGFNIVLIPACFNEVSSMGELYYSDLISVSLNRVLTGAIVIVVATVLSSCTQKLIRHEPRNAAIVAARFAEEAIINGDLPNALELLTSKESSQNERKAKVLDFISEVKSSGSEPESIWAVEYEPVPGTYFVRIFLLGKDKRNEITYYALLLESSNALDYKVVEFAYNGTTAFPTSPLRKPF